jgi:hypothetical protein
MTKEAFEEEYPFEVSGLFAGIRTQNLSFEASLFELIDNSIGHGDADKIDVRIEWFENNKNIKRVAVIDNGKGMNRRTLFNALKTGKSGTYNDRSTIGRFGFGLKAGGLNQCRIIEVYSKEKNSDSYCGILDFDSFLNGKEKISPPIEKNIPDEFSDIIEDNGTVVIWNNLDIAQGPDNNSELDEFKYVVGRTFRKFIGEEIIATNNENELIAIPNKNKKTITINNKKIIPWDPLYFTKVPGFIDDPKSNAAYQGELIVPIHLAEEMNEEEKSKLKKYNFDSVNQDNLFAEDKNGVEGDTIKIRFTVLPKEWREMRGKGDSDFNKERWIHKNEGISILRAGREVSRRSLYSITGKFDTIDRWWGLEIDYPPTLDRWFQIKNVKVGLEPNKELAKMLRDYTSIRQTKSRAQDEIQSYWGTIEGQNNSKTIICPKCSTKNDKKSEECSDCGETLTKNEHEDVEELITDSGFGQPKVFEEMDEEEKKKYFEDLEIRFDDFDAATDRERFEQLTLKFLNTSKLPPNMSFIDINPGIGTTELTYNLTHVFFRKINEIMDRQRELGKKINDDLGDEELSDDLRDTVNKMRYCIDLLLGSFASAHVALDPYAKQDVKITLKNLMNQWTTMLEILTDDKDFETRTKND